jgi:hypothetical protein
MLCVFLPSGIASALGPSVKQRFAISIFIANLFSAEHSVLCFQIFYCDAEYRTVKCHCAECHNAPFPNVIFIFFPLGLSQSALKVTLIFSGAKPRNSNGGS